MKMPRSFQGQISRNLLITVIWICYENKYVRIWILFHSSYLSEHSKKSNNIHIVAPKVIHKVIFLIFRVWQDVRPSYCRCDMRCAEITVGVAGGVP